METMTESQETPENTAENPDNLLEVLDEGACQKRLKFEVPSEIVIQEFETNYKQLKDSIQLPGFRKGRVPRTVLERRFGEKIAEEVKEELMHNNFNEAVDKHELRIISRAEFENVDFSPTGPFRFEAAFEVAPEFQLPEYKGIEVDARSTAVTDDEVERELESLRQNYSEFADLPLGDLQEEDVVVADVTLGGAGDGDSEEQPSIEREDVYLKIGMDRVDNIPVEGLSEKLLGATEGAELFYDVEVPADFPREELREKKTRFKVVVKSAKRKQLPEINDEFLEKLGVDSADALKSNLRENLENRRRVDEEHRQEEAILEKLCTGLEMDLPQKLLDSKKEELGLSKAYRLMREGKSKEEVDQLVAEDESSLAEAKKDLTQLFLLDRIATEENILVTEDEVAQRVQAIAYAYNRDPNEVVEEYAQRGELAELRNGLLREKVRSFLRKRAKVNAVEGGESNEGEVSASSDDA